MLGNTPSFGAPAGVILAGGRSQRMGGGRKALLNLHGKPLLQHVIDRSLPQTDSLYLSVESEEPAYHRFGLEQLADPIPGHAGPLGGLLAALQRLQRSADAEWLLMLPCDAPFIPSDLGERLLAHACSEHKDVAVISTDGTLQPTFSVWNLRVVEELERAVSGGMAGFKQFLRLHPFASLRWKGTDPKTGAPPFLNINDQDDLARAQRYASSAAAGRGCSV